MNRIVIVGNGFDLAHGLKTSYKDFIDWYWEQKLDPVQAPTLKDKLCTLITPGGINWYMFLWEHAGFSIHTRKNYVEYIFNEENGFTKESTPFFGKLIQSIETKGWVDIENEYYLFLKRILSKQDYDTPEILNSELDFIKAKLITYLDLITKKDINENIINVNIAKSIYEPINSNDIAIGSKNKCPQDRRAEYPPESVLILNFNYTPTADLYLRNSFASVNHIHGTLAQPESVIFGYGDELDKGFKELLNMNENSYLSNIKSIKYLESNNYRKLLDFIESDLYQIYIMGHSCGNSDRTLLNTLFEHANCVSIKPFYYQKADGSDNYTDIVQNISRNFTDMKLMRDRVVNKTYCKPFSIDNIV